MYSFEGCAGVLANYLCCGNFQMSSNPANTLPPQYDDALPTDYDPEFTADISTKMRIPERLSSEMCSFLSNKLMSYTSQVSTFFAQYLIFLY